MCIYKPTCFTLHSIEYAVFMYSNQHTKIPIVHAIYMLL